MSSHVGRALIAARAARLTTATHEKVAAARAAVPEERGALTADALTTAVEAMDALTDVAAIRAQTITDAELRAVLVAWDELLSYMDTVGDEGSLDDEEMPDGKLRQVEQTLRHLLERHGLLTRAAPEEGGA